MENISIAAKLGLGFGIVIFFSFILTLTGWIGLTNVIDSADNLSAIQNLNNVIANTKSARENYLRSMDERDKNQLGENIQLMTSMLKSLKSHFNAEADFTRVTTALALLNQYNDIYIELVHVVDQKSIQSNNVLRDAQLISDSLIQLANNTTNSAKDIGDWQTIAKLNAAAIRMEKMQQNAHGWLVTGLEDHTIAKSLMNDATEISRDLQQITANFASQDIQTTILAENALIEKYEQLVTLDLSVDAITDKFNAVAKQLRDIIDEIQTMQLARKEAFGSKAKLLLAMVSVLTIVIGACASVFISKQIATPIHDTAEAAARIANGDLTNALSSSRKDEVGVLQEAIGHMTRSLKDLISNVSFGIAEMSSAATELSAVTEQNQQGMRQQHAEIEQVATAMNEMTTTVHDVAKNAEHAAEATSNAQLVTNSGNAAVAKAITSVEQLCDEVDGTSIAMDALAKQSDSIGSVLEVIKTVAEQTNLLALNAAIEAARAGEAGRGFAVVADEVRSLAQRTQHSTSEIESMIQLLQSEAQKALAKMASSKDIAATNASNAASVGDMFENIAFAVNDVQQMNQQIATAAEEQSVVAEEINRRITQVNEIADQTAESSQETASAAERLAALSEQLHTSISGFKVA